MFEDYLLAVRFPVPAADATDAVVTAIGQRKAAFLQSSLSTEGYRVYCSLTGNTREPYADAVTSPRFFRSAGRHIFSRAQFIRRQQIGNNTKPDAQCFHKPHIVCHVLDRRTLALYARPNYNSSNESVRLTDAVL